MSQKFVSLILALGLGTACGEGASSVEDDAVSEQTRAIQGYTLDSGAEAWELGFHHFFKVVRLEETGTANTVRITVPFKDITSKAADLCLTSTLIPGNQNDSTVCFRPRGGYFFLNDVDDSASLTMDVTVTPRKGFFNVHSWSIYDQFTQVGCTAGQVQTQELRLVETPDLPSAARPFLGLPFVSDAQWNYDSLTSLRGKKDAAFTAEESEALRAQCEALLESTFAP